MSHTILVPFNSERACSDSKLTVEVIEWLHKHGGFRCYSLPELKWCSKPRAWMINYWKAGWKYELSFKNAGDAILFKLTWL